MSDNNPDLKFKILWLIIGYGLIAFVIHASLTTSPIQVDVNYFDKYAHTAGYFVLMGWFVQIYHSRRAVLFWGVFFIAMGIGMEFLQELGGVRQYDIYDMLANGLGVVIAWLMSMTIFSKILLHFENLFIKK
ncbi:MAG: VanZ family protein [Gammaproteobacteria bacterium]|nr:VanZ family protein [Gammaproteobacteria bacterium]